MDSLVSDQVSKRLPIAAEFGKRWYKRPDREKFPNGMNVIPAHADEKSVPNLKRMSEVRILEDTVEEFQNCDGTTDYIEHKKTNKSIITTVVDDELLISYLDITSINDTTENLTDGVYIDDMTVGEWLTHAKHNPGSLYRSASSEWVARDC